MKQQPKVNEVNEFLEIASDFEDPLEVIRESLSNAYDANASHVEFTIRERPHGSDIVIEDDGGGMSRQDLESFFDLGNSRKEDAIGYKGHGTKIFYKSDEIVVNTSRDGTTLHAEMKDPWRKLNNKELPEYTVTETPSRKGRDGTLIRISGFRSGQGLGPESLTYNKIEHYLKWKTIAGSTAHFFEDNHHDMKIEVDLDEEIDDTKGKLEIDSNFTFPDEQLEPGDGDFPAERMCKHFPSEGGRVIEVEHEGGTSEVEIVGMVAGKEARNELATYGKHSAQFGVWLAKDHIKVEQLNEAVPDNVEHTHLMFIVNCQDIELSANRGKIRNKSSNVYQRLVEEVRHYLSKVCSHPWFLEYMEARRQGELNRKAQSQSDSVAQRRERLAKRTDFVPENRAELVLALERSNRKSGVKEIEVADYRPNDEVASFIRDGDDLKPTSVYLQVEDHFADDKPLETIDTVLAWEWGDRDSLREYARQGYHDGMLSVDFAEQKLEYEKDGERKQVDVVLVSKRLRQEKPLAEIQ
ncbi:ATP-binding protein [Halorussus amylolyticus]|uniref:ATP-binding protein n=1 Tax=Halorussus amylolyticus TaxID=1126242 RepID=UPI00104B8013|nr:ATP-binding protein [Halorussus amylolyticus]